MNKIFVLGDGNQIRVKIESHLFKNELRKVNQISQNITNAINQLKKIAIEDLDAEIIMAGGDDLLIRVDKEKYNKKILKKMSSTFKELTECSFSFGVGETIEVAHSNLNKAKIYKKTIVEND